MPTQYCQCGAKYRFPDTAVGKRAKCKKCGAMLVLSADRDDGTIPLAPAEASRGSDDDASDTFPVQGRIFQPASSIKLPTPGGAMLATTESATGHRGYWSDVLWSILFPANPSNLVTFLVIWCFMAVAPLVLYVPLIGFFLQWIIAGWFAAFQFEVLGSAAAGEDDIPQPNVESGMVPDLLLALLKWIGSWVLVMAPAVAYLISLVAQGVVNGMDAPGLLSDGIVGMMKAPDELIVFKGLVCAGVFFWPIVILCAALDSLAVVYRVDLLALTILRTLPIYLMTVFLVFGAVAVEYVLSGAIAARGASGQGGNVRGTVSTTLALHVAATGVHVYMSIVVMRLIGLYYVYGKKRFAWSWE